MALPAYGIFIGHTVLAEQVANAIGWPPGSPFQTELAFYTLGTAVAALICIYYPKAGVSLLAIAKSVFLLGAAFVHILDWWQHDNVNPSNLGITLAGDIVYPILFLSLVYMSWGVCFSKENS